MKYFITFRLQSGYLNIKQLLIQCSNFVSRLFNILRNSFIGLFFHNKNKNLFHYKISKINKYTSNFPVTPSPMKAGKRSVLEAASQKSLTHQTLDSQTNNMKIFFMPNQSQRRFTRKNNNSSIQKLVHKGEMHTQNDDTTMQNYQVNTPRSSMQKMTPSFLRLSTELTDNQKNRNLISFNQIKGGSFNLSRSKQIRISNLEETIRISQQKCTSKGTDKQKDQKPARNVYESKTNNVSILKAQLQLKQQEVLLLQDQRKRFRITIEQQKKKQKQLQLQLEKSQEQRKKIKKLTLSLEQLSKKSEQYSENIKKLEQENRRMKKQLVQQIKEKAIIERQLNIFVNKQVPKNIRELQSCREIYLEQIISGLKKDLSKNKSEVENEMEHTIQNLRIKIINLEEQINILQIKNRLLEKKTTDSKRNLESYSSAKEQLKDMRLSFKHISSECELLRAENVKIKKQMKKLKISNIPQKKSLQRRGSHSQISYSQQRLKRVDSQSQSLNLSISTCSR